jgi:Fur family transcriptional regulator, peroxide stress response regulator
VNPISAQEINNRIQAFSQLCREYGLKVTHQRLEIFRALLETKGHPTAEEVFTRIRHTLPTISIDTVYRTLTLFEEHDLIISVQCLHDKGRFDSNLSPHHHFICTSCKKIVDFNWEEFDHLQRPAAIQSLGKVLLEKVEMRGICQECLKKNNS